MRGVFRHAPPIHRHAGVRALSWREPAFTAGYENTSGQASIYAGAGYSLQQTASPAIKIGDTFLVSKTTPGNYTDLVNDDGTVNEALGGDLSRQSFGFYLYRRISGTIEGPGLIWINEVAPVWTGTILISVQPLGVPIAPITLQPDYVDSASGDVLTFAITAGSLPDGITLSAGVISGTPTTLEDSTFTITATDSTGMSADSQPCFISVQTVLPLHAQKVTRHRGRTLVVLPYEDVGNDMTPAERAQQAHLDALRSDMQGVFSGDQGKIQQHVDAYREEQQRIAAMSQSDKMFGKLGLQ